MINAERELVIILGQHRTGTSALAGALEACGLDFGPADRSPGEHNEKGHFENPAVNFLCEALLTPWTEVPTFGSAHEDLAEKILGEYRATRLGVKSREMLYLLPFWMRRTAKIRLVATLRHPLAFARSYRARSALDASRRGLDPARFVPELEGLIADWRRYYEDIVTLRRQIPFPILDFDLPIEDYLLELERSVRTLGLEYQRGPVREFVSDRLRHHVERDAPPGGVAELYTELRDLAAAAMPAVDAPTPEQIVRASSDLRPRRTESPTPAYLSVGWQNAYTALTETTVQLQLTTRKMADRLADAHANFDQQRAELLASIANAKANFDQQRTALLTRFAEAQAIHTQDREELLARFADAQGVYGEQHARVLKSSAAAQSEYERQYAELLTRFAQAQGAYLAQRELLLAEIAERDTRIARLEAKSSSVSDARLKPHAEPGDG